MCDDPSACGDLGDDAANISAVETANKSAPGARIRHHAMERKHGYLAAGTVRKLVYVTTWAPSQKYPAVLDKIFRHYRLFELACKTIVLVFKAALFLLKVYNLLFHYVRLIGEKNHPLTQNGGHSALGDHGHDVRK